MNKEREQMNVVIVGHVDHGKSTLVGRLLADTGSLPEGKLEAVKENCRRTAKPFEYAFLLDALKDEQSQGITIDTARSFFKSDKRDYIIIDAPGHIEFLKNMVTGAARAEAAMLVIDANEGIRENSKRHGYMLSFLGIKNINICVNKMDIVNSDEAVFNAIAEEYARFLQEINIKPKSFIPISAREGDNIANRSEKMNWYEGATVLEAFDEFEKAAEDYERDLRFPVQDIYKFTGEDDDRRIIAGRIESGTITIGDKIMFLPSNKESVVVSIEAFNTTEKQTAAFAGQSTGVTLDTQIYIKPGEIISKAEQRKPHVSNKFKANIFWMGKQPLVKEKTYKLKIASQQVPVVLSEIISVLDASELSSIENKSQIDRHDVAECVLEALKPVAFDEVNIIPEMGRFVVVDNYEIAGGGIILAPVFESDSVISKHIQERNYAWEKSNITLSKRSQKNDHKSALVVVTGEADVDKKGLAKKIEEKLFNEGVNAYFLGISNEMFGQELSTNDKTLSKLKHIQQLGELAHIVTDSGTVLITSISDIDEYELDMLKALNRPNKTLVINVGESQFSSRKIDLNLEPAEEEGLAMKKILYLINQAIALDPEFTI